MCMDRFEAKEDALIYKHGSDPIPGEQFPRL